MAKTTDLLQSGLPGRVLSSAARRFRGDSEGATAVEFALVSLPFFGLIGAIIQFAFIIWAGQNLDHHLQRAVRGLFTGSFQNANSAVKDPATILTTLRNTMCAPGGSTVVTVFRCADVKLNVTVSPSFAGGTSASPLNAAKGWNPSFESYTCAKPGDIVVVTAAVALPTYFRLLNPGILHTADGSYLLQSTSVFRTEPYQTTTATGC